MIEMTLLPRFEALLILFAVVVSTVWIAGCGGGGGGGGPSNTYVVTGQVLDKNSKTSTTVAVSGAVVSIGGKTATSNSSGNYRLEFTSAPTASTWSVDGSNATPAPGYYAYWAQLGIVTTTFDAHSLPMPAITETNTVMPTVYLWNESEPPPPTP